MKTREHQQVYKALNHIGSTATKAAKKCVALGCEKCPYGFDTICFFDMCVKVKKNLKKYAPPTATTSGSRERGQRLLFS